MIAQPLHVVQIGSDSSVFADDAPSDTAQRHVMYADVLEQLAPGSRLTSIVLGANATEPLQIRNLHVIAAPGNRLTSIRRAWRVLRSLRERDPISVITTQSIFEDAWLALAFRRRFDVPVVGQVHFDLFSDASLGRDPARRAYNRCRMTIAHRLMKRLSAVRVVSTDVAAEMRARRWHDSVKVIPVPSMLLSRDDGPSVHRDPLVLFVGRLAHEKGLDTWLAVARIVRDRVPAASFAIVGSGELARTIRAEARHPDWRGRLTVPGPVASGELGNWYRRASVLLLTSRHEGFGRVAAEALASGAVVVAPDIGGIRDIVQNGENGVLFAPRDIGAAAEAVVALLEDEESRRELAETGQRDVLNRFDPGRLSREWIDLLVNVAWRA